MINDAAVLCLNRGLRGRLIVPGDAATTRARMRILFPIQPSWRC